MSGSPGRPPAAEATTTIDCFQVRQPSSHPDGQLIKWRRSPVVICPEYHFNLLASLAGWLAPVLVSLSACCRFLGRNRRLRLLAAHLCWCSCVQAGDWRRPPARREAERQLEISLTWPRPLSGPDSLHWPLGAAITSRPRPQPAAGASVDDDGIMPVHRRPRATRQRAGTIDTGHQRGAAWGRERAKRLSYACLWLLLREGPPLFRATFLFGFRRSNPLQPLTSWSQVQAETRPARPLTMTPIDHFKFYLSSLAAKMQQPNAKQIDLSCSSRSL